MTDSLIHRSSGLPPMVIAQKEINGLG